MLAKTEFKLHSFGREYNYHLLLSFLNDGQLSVHATHTIFIKLSFDKY